MHSPEALLATHDEDTLARIVPLLPEPLRREVTLAYLLFRVADTLEDAWHRTSQERCEALAAFVELVLHPDLEKARTLSENWAASFVTTGPERQLLGETDELLLSLKALPFIVREHIQSQVARCAQGMIRALGDIDVTGRLCFTRREQLVEYCYSVSGIVGELLTELFVLELPQLGSIAEGLRERVVRFGEGVQLVNVLRDIETDVREGRSYLPACTSWREWAVKARWCLQGADEYVRLLEDAGADPGVVAFNALPVRLGVALLDQMDVEGRPGVRLPQALMQSLLESPVVANGAKGDSGRLGMEARQQCHASGSSVGDASQG